MNIFSFILIFNVFFVLNSIGQNPISIKVKKQNDIVFFYQKGAKSDTITKQKNNLFYFILNDSLKKSISISIDNGRFISTKNDSIIEFKFMPNLKYEAKFIEENTSALVKKIKFMSLINGSTSINKNEIVFLFAGKLEEKKQPNLLLESFVSLESSNAFLIIVVSGELDNTLRHDYSDHPFIKFIGFQNQYQMPAVYNCCDVFVLPSKGPGETWGLSINEAMAAGKAIIASEKCGASYDLIQHLKNGFIFQSNNIKSLRSALVYFEKNKKEAEIMGNASYDIINEYSFTRDCIAIESCVQSMQIFEQ